MKPSYWALGLCVGLALLLGGCAPSAYTEQPAGFFSGLWHGFIILFSAFGKLFSFDVGIHASHNTGWPYWLGFILGLSMSIGVGGKAGQKARRSK
jgi:hypothetical protein